MRQLLPPFSATANEGSKTSKEDDKNDQREVGPFYFQASRASSMDLPYAAGTTSTRKRERVLDTPPDSNKTTKRREINMGRSNSHADFNDMSSDGFANAIMSQATSEDTFFNTQTSDSVTFEFPSSPLEINNYASSPPDHSIHNDDDEGNTTVKLTSSFRSDPERKADKIIREAIEEGVSTISLSGCELDTVPHQLQDLNHMVITEKGATSLQGNIRLFMDRNYFTTIPSFLFSIEHLTVLVLRNNNLVNIPPAIGRLTNLVELSIAQNQLRYLPSEILDLPKLAIFSVHPNQFLDYDGAPSNEKRNDGVIHTEFHVEERQQSKRSVKSLTEICQLALAKALHGTTTVTQDCYINERITKLVNEARYAYDQQTQCGICHKRIIKGVGYCYEWRDAVKGQGNVVFKRNFCSFQCVDLA